MVIAACGGTVQSNGTGRASGKWKAYRKALNHFMSNGQQLCSTKQCQQGNCTFHLSAAQFEAIEVQDPQQIGDKVQISVRGEGSCICS